MANGPECIVLLLLVQPNQEVAIQEQSSIELSQ
jgi:hypothetical protein